MSENLIVLLGGRMAEKLVLDDISTGASMIWKGLQNCPEHGYPLWIQRKAGTGGLRTG